MKSHPCGRAKETAAQALSQRLPVPPLNMIIKELECTRSCARNWGAEAKRPDVRGDTRHEYRCTENKHGKGCLES